MSKKGPKESPGKFLSVIIMTSIEAKYVIKSLCVVHPIWQSPCLHFVYGVSSVLAALVKCASLVTYVITCFSHVC